MSDSNVTVNNYNFSIGQDVEVSMEEEGFEGSYFAAKVVSINDNGLITVKYETLLEDNSENQFLSEDVKPHQLRPVPPEIPVSRFFGNEDVDVFDNDGWWVGIISGKDAADIYAVYFPDCDEEICYHVSQLRVHQEWIDGQWVRTRKAASNNASSSS